MRNILTTMLAAILAVGALLPTNVSADLFDEVLACQPDVDAPDGHDQDQCLKTVFDELEYQQDQVQHCLGDGATNELYYFVCREIRTQRDWALSAVEGCIGGEPSSLCYQVNQCVFENTPAFPCNPDPQKQHELSGCLIDCVTEPVQRVAPPNPLTESVYVATVPDSWLVICEVTPLGIPMVVLNDEESCPVGTYDGTIEQLTHEEDKYADLPRDDPSLVDLLYVTHGTCILTLEATVYGGVGLQEDEYEVPCAFVDPA